MRTLLAVVLFIGGVAGQALRHVRFSEDGRYALAQNDSEIVILTIQPFAVLFRIPAENAQLTQFTPDSRSVVFIASAARVDPQRIILAPTPSRVDRWSIAERSRVESATLPPMVCGTEGLSPDGALVVCLDLTSTLTFVDVAAGKTIFEKKEFTWLFRTESIVLGQLGLARIEFSPDTRFVVVTPENAEGSALIWDLRQRSVVNLTGGLKQLKRNTAVFIAPDRVIVAAKSIASEVKQGVMNGKVIAFPSGKTLSEPKMPNGPFFRATNPGFVIVRPFGGGVEPALQGDEFGLRIVTSNRAAAAELSTGLVIISETPVIDVFGRMYLAEPTTGNIGLYEIGKGLQATVLLHK